jgi:hypothetical protein
MDGRTSEFCQMINGKTFLVEDARSTIVQVLNLDNPDDAKHITPWPSQSKASLANLSKLSAQELTNLNLHVPPFHPGCRTLCVVVGKQIKTLPFSPLTVAQARKASLAKQLTDAIPDTAVTHFQNWGSNKYRWINNVVRHPEIVGQGWVPPNGDSMDEVLSAALALKNHLKSNSAAIRKDVILYRGIDSSRAITAMQKNWSQYDIDEYKYNPRDFKDLILEDAGFMSFTYDKDATESFGSFVVRVKARDGDKGWADIATVSSNVESELLTYGRKFRILGYDSEAGVFDIEFLD